MAIHNSNLSKLLLGGALSVLLLACAPKDNMAAKLVLPNGIEHVETVGKQGEVSIPYEKFTLANGLTVVLHEDKSDPLVHVDVTYHVGSGREDIGKE